MDQFTRLSSHREGKVGPLNTSPTLTRTQLQVASRGYETPYPRPVLVFWSFILEWISELCKCCRRKQGSESTQHKFMPQLAHSLGLLLPLTERITYPSSTNPPQFRSAQSQKFWWVRQQGSLHTTHYPRKSMLNQIDMSMPYDSPASLPNWKVPPQ